MYYYVAQYKLMLRLMRMEMLLQIRNSNCLFQIHCVGTIDWQGASWILRRLIPNYVRTVSDIHEQEQHSVKLQNMEIIDWWFKKYFYWTGRRKLWWRSNLFMEKGIITCKLKRCLRSNILLMPQRFFIINDIDIYCAVFNTTSVRSKNRDCQVRIFRGIEQDRTREGKRTQ